MWLLPNIRQDQSQSFLGSTRYISVGVRFHKVYTLVKKYIYILFKLCNSYLNDVKKNLKYLRNAEL